MFKRLKRVVKMSDPIHENDESATTNTINQSQYNILGSEMPINFNLYVVFDDITKREFLVRKVLSFESEHLYKGLFPKAPNSNISAVEHVMGLNKSRFISASSAFPDGAPNITGEKIYIDVKKTLKSGAKIINTEDIAKDLIKYKQMYPHTQARVDKLIYYIKNIEHEVLIEPSQGKPVPAAALWKESHFKTACSIGKAARVVQVFGIALTAYDLGNAAYTSYKQNSIKPITQEALKQAGGWGATWLGFKLGGALGASLCAATGPGAFIGGLVGGIAFGIAANLGASWIEDYIYENE